MIESKIQFKQIFKQMPFIIEMFNIYGYKNSEWGFPEKEIKLFY